LTQTIFEQSLSDKTISDQLIGPEECKGIRLNDVRFIRCKLVGMNFFHIDPFLLSFSFEGCLVMGCNFNGLKMPKTSFKECKMRDCMFSEADISGGSFVDCEFRDTVFHHTNLEKVDFSGAMGYEINPTTNRIKRAKFTLPEAASLLNYLEINLK
jgi:fluoroquinolone resistance protein